jgi:hypothetical protein
MGSILTSTIAKKSLNVIFCGLLAALSFGCHRTVVEGGRPPEFGQEEPVFQRASIVGRIGSNEIRESSGITASKCQEGLLWTHNDSGDGPFIFALDPLGRHLGTWKVAAADNVDWEDIASYKDAAGNCFLVIGDIGNRNKEPRTEHTIYWVAEPGVDGSASSTSRKSPAQTAPARSATFSYPDGPQDAESLLIHPLNGTIYVLTKRRDAAAGVYRLPAENGPFPLKLVRVSDITVPAVPNGLITGGDISSDGRHLLLTDYFAAYEFTIPDGAADFDEIWRQRPAVIDLGEREQGEAIAYSPDGNSIFATSEGKNPPLMRADRRQ